MSKSTFTAVICLLFPSVVFGAQPQPICANVAQSFLNSATQQELISQGCSDTIDGLLLQVEARDLAGTWVYTALIAETQDACISAADNCCIRMIDLNGGTLHLQEDPYPNKGWLNRDQRELADLCAQLVAVP